MTSSGEKLFRINKMEALGKRIQPFIEPASVERFNASLKTASEGKKLSNIEINLKAGKEHITANISFAPIKKDGAVKQIHCVAVDISRMKAAEDAIRKEKEIVDREVTRRTAQLKREKRKIEKMLRLKTEFMNQLSHDLRTPLTPIAALLPSIRKKAADKDMKKRIEICMRNAEYLQGLVSSVLNLSRLDSGKISLNLEPLDIRSLVQESLMNLKSILNKSNITVTNKVEKSLIANADPIRLKEVLNNCIDNARKAMPDGGRITIVSKKDKNSVMISIIDTGKGMEPDTAKRVFDEFYKGDKSRHDPKSFGLGLNICQRIIKLHKGRMWIASKGLGKGCEVHFTIPIRARKKIYKVK